MIRVLCPKCEWILHVHTSIESPVRCVFCNKEFLPSEEDISEARTVVYGMREFVENTKARFKAGIEIKIGNRTLTEREFDELYNCLIKEDED